MKLVLRPAQRGEFLRRIAAAAAHCAHYGSQSDALDPDAPYVVRRDGADVLAGTVAKVVRLTMVDTPSGPVSTGYGLRPSSATRRTISAWISGPGASRLTMKCSSFIAAARQPCAGDA